MEERHFREKTSSPFTQDVMSSKQRAIVQPEGKNIVSSTNLMIVNQV